MKAQQKESKQVGSDIASPDREFHMYRIKGRPLKRKRPGIGLSHPKSMSLLERIQLYS